GPAEAVVELPLAALTSADPGATVAVEPDGTLLVKTLARHGSYAAEWSAPAPAAADYRFTLEYTARDGNVSIGVLSGARDRWIATATGRTVHDDVRSASVVVRLDLHERHSVVVTNDRPGGATPSEVLVRRVTLQSAEAVAYAATLVIHPAADS